LSYKAKRPSIIITFFGTTSILSKIGQLFLKSYSGIFTVIQAFSFIKWSKNKSKLIASG
jgi:hypothetical protein